MAQRMASTRVFRSWFPSGEADVVVRRIVDGIGTDAPSLTMLFVSPAVDLDRLGTSIARGLGGPVLACTTAGELCGGLGYVEDGIAVASICSDRLRAEVYVIDDVGSFDLAQATSLGDRIRSHAGSAAASVPERFGVLLADGLCLQEERLAALLHGACGGFPIVGASAGDGGAFKMTHVWNGERFCSGSAAFAVLDTSLRHALFCHQHFEPGDVRMVVTKADPARRVLIELDGLPASQVYARNLGAVELDPALVAVHPILLQSGGRYYARGIQAWDERCMTLYCAIEEGMVVRLGRGGHLIDHLERQMDELDRLAPNGPLLTVAFDCILRRQEIMNQGDTRSARQVLANRPIVGFSTYGEQYNSLHINQTLTGFSLAA